MKFPLISLLACFLILSFRIHTTTGEVVWLEVEQFDRTGGWSNDS